VLRGIIDESPEKLQIVRLTRRGDEFEAHLVQSSTLADALKKPAVRAESMLDGIFSQAVVVLEADSDRIVYHSAIESLRDEIHLDIHFSTVGGSGAIADTCHLYRTLKIPVAVIADLDVLADPIRLERILTRLVDDEPGIKLIVDRAVEVGRQIKQVPPAVAPQHVRSRLDQVSSCDMDWSKEDDRKICRELRLVANDLDRLKRLKRGGIDALPPPLRDMVRQIVTDLACHGLFLVPVGELEQWFQKDEVPVSMERKWEWADAAATHIRASGPQQGRVWEFVRGVARFLGQ
jgi:hypothetical protein